MRTRQQMQAALDDWLVDDECRNCRKPDGGHYEICPIHALSVALKRLEEVEKLARDLLDMHERCPDCDSFAAGPIGHSDDCQSWKLLYPEASGHKAAEER